MDFLNRLAIFIAIGCLGFVLYEANQPESFSEMEQAQIQEIVGKAIQGHMSEFNSELEVKTDRVIEQTAARQSLEFKKENVTLLVNTSVRIASDAQAWKRKPAAFGGGQLKEGFEGLTLEQLGYPVDGSGRYNTMNGICELSNSSLNQLRIYCSNESLGNLIQVIVSGKTAQDIETKIMNTEKLQKITEQ